jgi:hypothetical protein
LTLPENGRQIGAGRWDFAFLSSWRSFLEWHSCAADRGLRAQGRAGQAVALRGLLPSFSSSSWVLLQLHRWPWRRLRRPRGARLRHPAANSPAITNTTPTANTNACRNQFRHVGRGSPDEFRQQFPGARWGPDDIRLRQRPAETIQAAAAPPKQRTGRVSGLGRRLLCTVRTVWQLYIRPVRNLISVRPLGVRDRLGE